MKYTYLQIKILISNRGNGENSIRKKWNKIDVALFGATTVLYQFRPPLTVLSPTGKV